jgi:4-hydroxy-2-oxoheptanedioate aldolase
VKKIYEAAKANGKWCGRLVNDGVGAIAEFEKYDWDSLAITGDTKAIVNWYGDQIKTVRSKFQ